MITQKNAKDTDERAAFEESRRNGLGGSDIGALVGVSKWKTPLEVWKQKMGLDAEPTPDAQERFDWGHLLEPVVRERFCALTGRQVLASPPMMTHPKFDFARANLDGLVLDDSGSPCAVLEIKTAAVKTAAWGDEGSDVIPSDYAAQVQWYMEIADLEEAYVAVLFHGNKMEIFRVPRNRWLGAELLALGKRFWEDYVLTRTAPPPQGKKELADYWKNPEGFVEADGEMVGLIGELKRLKEEQKNLDEAIESAENRIKSVIGEHESLVADGVLLATWKYGKPSMRLDTGKLKSDYPDIYAGCLKESAASRRFLVK